MGVLTGFNFNPTDLLKKSKQNKENGVVQNTVTAPRAPYNPNTTPAPTTTAATKTPKIDLTSGLKKGTGVYPSQYGANMSQEDINKIADYGTAWNKAKDVGDTAGMLASNAGAENLRQNKYGFTGGASGSEYNLVPTMASKGLNQGGYNSAYAPEIQKLTYSMLNQKPFSYDPNTDEAFKIYKQQMEEQGQRAFNNALAGSSIPGIATSSVGQQIAQNANLENQKNIQGAYGTFFDKAYQRYLQDQQTNANNLNSLLGIDTTSYNRNQNALNRTDKINEAQGYVNPTANIAVPENVREQLKPYANDYSAYAKANPNTELGKYARTLANEKMFSNQDLLKKYGTPFKTSAQNTQDLQNEAQRISNKYAPQIAQGQIDSTKFENEYKRLRNLNYPADEAAQRAATYANISQGNAQIGISQQNANTNKAQLDWMMNPNNPDNLYKTAQIGALGNKTNANTTNTIDDYVKAMDQAFIQTPNSDNGYEYKKDTAGIVNYAQNLEKAGVDPSLIDQILLHYGLPTGR